MADEVRPHSSPASQDPGGPAVDPVDEPESLEVEIPTPDLELEEPEPLEPARSASGDPVVLLTDEELAAPRASAERPPPPSQRGLRAAPESAASPLLAPGATTLPAPAPAVTLPAPAPVIVPAQAAPAEGAPPAVSPPAADAPGSPLLPPAGPVSVTPDAVPSDAAPSDAAPSDAVSSDAGRGPAAAGEALHSPSEPPSSRMPSEPIPLTTKAVGPAPAKTTTLRPGLVEPKRIIEVLGSNVPVLDSALEEEAIEDLDESEAHELDDVPSGREPEAELDLPVEVEDDLSPTIEVALDEAPEELAAGAASPGSELAAAAPAPAPSTPGAESVAAEELPDSADGEAVDGEAPPQSVGGLVAESVGAVSTPDEAAESAAQRRAKAPPNKRRRPPPPSSRLQDKAKSDPTSPAARKWWEEMFSEEFLRAIPILSPKQLEREVRFIDEALSVDRGGRVLDLACGAGQHAVELAARGYEVQGFDLSQSQLDWAAGLAHERGQRVQFTCGDMRELSYAETFDAVYCWNTSFGFFEEEKNVDVAQRIFRALRPGGRFLLDVVNRDFVVAQQPGQTWFEGDGCVCIDDVSIDFITSRMKVKRTLMLTNGKNRECTYSVRLYGLHELGKILHDLGFRVLTVSGRPEMPGVFFGSTSPRIIILAAKP